MDRLELGIASVFEASHPEFAKAVRRLRERGIKKSEIVRRVTKKTAGSQLVRGGMLILVDKIWEET